MPLTGRDPYLIIGGQQTDGTWRHTGRLIVATSFELQAGSAQPATLILPDGSITAPMLDPDIRPPTQAEWDALVARVAALEARPVITSLEDLTYGG